MKDSTITQTNYSCPPILFLVFCRPDTTARVFNAIRHAKPRRLYIASDGPRSDREGDDALVSEVHSIVTAVDWPCEVKTLFRTKNLGCKLAVSQAISWFFSEVDSGIILEDDCLPNPDFFRFCEAMLSRFECDSKVLAITGDNFQLERLTSGGSYYFSKYSHCWGWASWKRAWEKYDGNLQFWTKWRETEDWKATHPDAVERQYWKKILDKVHRNEINTWDYSWTASIWHAKGLVVTPNVNLVTNIGFGQDATHTKFKSKSFNEIKSQPIGTIIHNEDIKQNVSADAFVFEHHYGGRRLRWPMLPIYKVASTVWRGLKNIQSMF